MSPRDSVCLEAWTPRHGLRLLRVFHRSLPELRVEADADESGRRRLVAALALQLGFAADDFHRQLIGRALDDLN